MTRSARASVAAAAIDAGSASRVVAVSRVARGDRSARAIRVAHDDRLDELAVRRSRRALTPTARSDQQNPHGRQATTTFCSLFHNVSVVKQRTERGGESGRVTPSALGMRGAPGTVGAVAGARWSWSTPSPDDPPRAPALDHRPQVLGRPDQRAGRSGKSVDRSSESAVRRRGRRGTPRRRPARDVAVVGVHSRCRSASVVLRPRPGSRAEQGERLGQRVGGRVREPGLRRG